MQNVHFSPVDIAKQLQVNVSTIKRWVDRGMLESQRTPGGHRRITPEHLQKFLRTYPEFKKHSYILQRMRHETRLSPTSWQVYYRYLAENEIQKAEQYVDRFFLAGVSLADVLDGIIARALVHIGAAWAARTITIFEEHRMSFIVRLHLLHLDRYLPEPKGRLVKNAVVACPPGEHHEIPTQMLGIILKERGWRANVLGINVPVGEMEKAVIATSAKLLCVTSTYTQARGSAILRRLQLFMKKHKGILAYGGNGWRTSKKPQSAEHFSSLREFANYLK